MSTTHSNVAGVVQVMIGQWQPSCHLGHKVHLIVESDVFTLCCVGGLGLITMDGDPLQVNVLLFRVGAVVRRMWIFDHTLAGGVVAH